MDELEIIDGQEPFDHELSAKEFTAEFKRLQQENAKLRAGIQAAVDGIWSWVYSINSRPILDIYGNLKALLKGGCNG